MAQKDRHAEILEEMKRIENELKKTAEPAARRKLEDQRRALETELLALSQSQGMDIQPDRW